MRSEDYTDDATPEANFLRRRGILKTITAATTNSELLQAADWAWDLAFVEEELNLDSNVLFWLLDKRRQWHLAKEHCY